MEVVLLSCSDELLELDTKEGRTLEPAFKGSMDSRDKQGHTQRSPQATHLYLLT